MAGWAVAALAGGIIVVLTVIGCASVLSVPGRPAPLRSVVDAIAQTGLQTSDLPTPAAFNARDETAVAYRTYPAAATDRIAILIHRSSVYVAMMHLLAQALQLSGTPAYALDFFAAVGTGRADIQ